MKKNKLAIIGRGNVATHLANAFRCDMTMNITIVNPRTLEDMVWDADICLISVSDNAIPLVASALKDFKGIIAHTSGSTPMSVLNICNKNYGVFYPLQTFSKDKHIDYSRIPIFIEAANDFTKNALISLAGIMTQKVYEADSDKRSVLHLASVFACNYVNHLWSIADSILKDEGLNIEILYPLIEETVDKIHRCTPANAQTGPAIRSDSTTISHHINMLRSQPQLQNLYKILALDINPKCIPNN